ncbi:hypothetical protein KEM54_005520 [Ascosphaera aggregata]|nr:hypothetical protein KEM54_005520 [Ascosphaera aggregata]
MAQTAFAQEASVERNEEQAVMGPAVLRARKIEFWYHIDYCLADVAKYKRERRNPPQNGDIASFSTSRFASISLINATSLRLLSAGNAKVLCSFFKFNPWRGGMCKHFSAKHGSRSSSGRVGFARIPARVLVIIRELSQCQETDNMNYQGDSEQRVNTVNPYYAHNIISNQKMSNCPYEDGVFGPGHVSIARSSNKGKQSSKDLPLRELKLQRSRLVILDLVV